MNDIFPEYAKTDHPDVLDWFKQDNAEFAAFLDKMRAVSLKYTGDEFNAVFTGRSIWHENCMVGFARSRVDVSALPGRWKKGKNHDDAHEPFANNPILDEFPTHRSKGIPGRGNIFIGDGQMGPGTVFEHDGEAYSRIGFQPRSGDARDHEAYGWTEIKPSEFHKALEDEQARREAEADRG